MKVEKLIIHAAKLRKLLKEKYMRLHIIFRKT